MRQTVMLILMLLIPIASNAQKPNFDSTALINWTSVHSPEISDDGKYASYLINNLPTGSQTLIIKGLENKWEKRIIGASAAQFTNDNRHILYRNAKDTLFILQLDSDRLKTIPQVKWYQLSKIGKIDWLAYTQQSSIKEICLVNLGTQSEIRYKGAETLVFSPDRQSLVLLKYTTNGSMEMLWEDLSKRKRKSIWKGKNAEGISFNSSGSQLAFIASSGSTKLNSEDREIWLYKKGAASATLVADRDNLTIDSNLIFQKNEGFSDDDQRIYLTFEEKPSYKPAQGAVMVDIWSYHDPKLQSVQLKESNPRTYIGVLNLKTHKVIRLQQKNDLPGIPAKGSGHFVRMTNSKGFYNEYWNPLSKPNYYIISTSSGERIPLSLYIEGFSGDGKFAFGTEKWGCDYFSYEIKTGIKRNLTDKLSVPLEVDNYDLPGAAPRGLSFACRWGKYLDQIILYDKYDIWLVSLNDDQAPINLTNGFGRRNNITFRLANNLDIDQSRFKDGRILLIAFNSSNKQNGFYCTNSIKVKDPQPLTMANFLYRMTDYPDLYERGTTPLKALNNDVWILSREGAGESRNLFWTKDFKKIEPLSHNYPEKGYNGLVSELILFPNLDGTPNQGILFKPVDFDTTKKYPVIFHYYDKMSQNLNVFEKPGLSSGDMNIPWFVSRGYIVFTPDIIYKVGEPGQSAVNSVLGATNYLVSNFPWIDSQKLGLQGHSFGGYETNFIITQSNRFAAAVSSSGLSDIISAYGSLWGTNGSSMSEYYEFRRGGIGAALPDEPQTYAKNSPIMFVKDVNTPLLMMNNHGDKAVPFGQGLEFFISLRRKGKKAWMLQYDNEGHSLINKKSTLDYTNKMVQFFDHYLKGKDMPSWMEHGRSAASKGVL